MIIHQPQITVDFRPFDFTTLCQLDALAADMLQDFAEDMPHARVAEIIISERQLKQLRFERYLQGVPIKQVKQEKICHVWHVPVMVTEFEEGCPNCGE